MSERAEKAGEVGGGDGPMVVKRMPVSFFERDLRILDRLAESDGLGRAGAIRMLLRREEARRVRDGEWAAAEEVVAGAG